MFNYGLSIALVVCLAWTVQDGNLLNAQTLMVGASLEQARTLISYVEYLVKNSPAIESLFKINKNIIYNQTSTSKNRIEIRSSDAGKINSVGVGMGMALSVLMNILTIKIRSGD